MLAITAGAGGAVAGGILPAYVAPWWIDQAGHFAGGVALALLLRIVVSRAKTVVLVIVLSLLWEVIEWSIGTPFHVTVTDTQLDLLAGWAGAGLALLLETGPTEFLRGIGSYS